MNGSILKWAFLDRHSLMITYVQVKSKKCLGNRHKITSLSFKFILFSNNSGKTLVAIHRERGNMSHHSYFLLLSSTDRYSPAQPSTHLDGTVIAPSSNLRQPGLKPSPGIKAMKEMTCGREAQVRSWQDPASGQDSTSHQTDWNTLM